MKIGISHVKWVFSQATGSFSGIDEDVFASVVHALTGVWLFPHGNLNFPHGITKEYSSSPVNLTHRPPSRGCNLTCSLCKVRHTRVLDS